MSRTTSLIFGVYFIKIHVEWMTALLISLGFLIFCSLWFILFLFLTVLYTYINIWRDVIIFVPCYHLSFPSLWPLSSSSLVPMSLWLKVCLPLLELPLNQQLFGKGWSPVDTFSISYGALRVPSLVQVSIYAVCSWWPWPCHSWVTAFCATPGSNFFILSSPSSMIFIKPGRVT